MKYQAAIDWLYSTQLFGIKLGLENVRWLFDELKLFGKLRGRQIVHVAGTNGKGSVCAMIDSIFRAAGKKSGLFTSPHLVTFRERIRVNGKMIPESSVAEGLAGIRRKVENRDPHPTFFEIATVLAINYFCESDCEVLVIETGMGGRLDATNLLPADVSVITPIGPDHQRWLGETLAEIAAEKAGIIKPGVPVVIARQETDAVEVIFDQAKKTGAPAQVVEGEIQADWELALTGSHQRENAALAVAAARLLEPDLEQSVIRQGLSSVQWLARFQRFDDRIVIDGAHNEPAIAALVQTWRESFPDEKATVIFGGVSTKATAAILNRLQSIAAGFIFAPVQSQRGLSVRELTEIWQVSVGNGNDLVETAESAAEAIDLARRRPGPILITGSLYLAGDALAELEGNQPFEVSEQ